MSIPYWTDGCIDTLSGIYFESSPTAPAQFLVGSYVSKEPSRSQRNLPYRTLDLARGVPALRNLGVRYYVAFTPEAKKAARLRSDLSLVTSANRFEVYEVADHAIVTALDIEPVVLTNVGTSQTSGWNDAGIARLDRPAEFPVPFAADGPPGWQRAALDWERTAAKPVYGATVKPMTLASQFVGFRRSSCPMCNRSTTRCGSGSIRSADQCSCGCRGIRRGRRPGRSVRTGSTRISWS